MDQIQGNKDMNTSSVVDTAEHRVASVGRLLRAGRERMGWSVEDVVSQIKLAPRQIHALEADDFESLPEPAFVRGFVRSYAKVLQLDPQPLLDALPGAQASPVKANAVQVDAPFPKESSERRQNMNLLIAAFLLALLIAGFAAWQANTQPQLTTDAVNTVSEGALVTTNVELPAPDEIAASSEVAATDAPTASGVQEAQTVDTVPVEENASVSKLHMTFDKESWIEITELSGKILAKKVYQSGEELNIEGVAPFNLVIGHASSVHLYYQGKLVDLMTYVSASSDVARLKLE